MQKTRLLVLMFALNLLVVPAWAYEVQMESKTRCNQHGGIWHAETPVERVNGVTEITNCTIPDDFEARLEEEVHSGNIESLRHRLEAGLSPDYRFASRYGLSILMVALDEKNCAMAELLLEYGANPNPRLPVIPEAKSHCKHLFSEND